MKSRKVIVIAILLIAFGSAVLLYPAVSEFVNQVNGSYAIQTLQKEIASSDQISEIRKSAEAYNERLIKGEEPEDYYAVLDIADGMMGYIQIPKIKVKLPIYHGVEEAVLSKGVGHMPQSAFPIGGIGNHSVLTGHTGLPSAKLFTDLTELMEGDTFYIQILNETLCYQVDQIKVVLPTEGQDLMPVAGKDYCTLLTCTPYGVNSHRLLVRGVRTELPAEIKDTESVRIQKKFIPIGLVIPVVLLLILSAVIALFLIKKY